ncbi:unnamed protein product [Lampetra fluviatilis]
MNAALRAPRLINGPCPGEVVGVRQSAACRLAALRTADIDGAVGQRGSRASLPARARHVPCSTTMSSSRRGTDVPWTFPGDFGRRPNLARVSSARKGENAPRELPAAFASAEGGRDPGLLDLVSCSGALEAWTCPLGRRRQLAAARGPRDRGS